MTYLNPELKKGDTAFDFVLWGVDDAYHSLQELKGMRGTLIIFMSNQCPAVSSKIPEIKRIAHEFKSRGITVIGVNANESENYPEESFEKMQEYFKKWNIDFYYLHDDAQSIAKTYGAACTPDLFFLDRDLRLVFRSRIHEMYDAIVEFLEQGKISRTEQLSVGSSIKWRFAEM